MNLEVRSEVIEYGALPQCPWLAQVESLQHIKEIMVRLLQSATCDDQGRSEFWGPGLAGLGCQTGWARRLGPRALPHMRIRALAPQVS